MYEGKYLFRFHDAILLGCCSGARMTTASLGMVNDIAKSQIPGFGYTVTYAVGNTLLTIWGMVIVMLLTQTRRREIGCKIAQRHGHPACRIFERCGKRE
jgi:hypothetical protein